ncbi:MAG: carboxymuconolactone decarboxylase family protein [Hyphomicrobiaceae bacterium TMED74]|nr:carboxymuconolactone decarboxylase [Filomicrobium sp.]RPG37005.1 MAG: carboxymuconolactone decarboxylase family protein [Hyphomicrobiaceae bacterium TMED74]
MPRIEPKTRADIPDHLQPLWDKMLGYGDFADQAGVMAYRMPIFEKGWGMLVELSEEAHTPKRYIELAIVTVSLLNECPYCVSHHAPKLAVQGISEAGASTLLDYQDHPELDDVDKLVVEYAIAVTTKWNRTRDEIFGRLREHFTDAQIVEITWRTALCGAFNRFNDILQLESGHAETEADAAE